MNKKRLFFSLEGVDINDDDALAAFTQHVWEQATAVFTDVQPIDSADGEIGDDGGTTHGD